MSSVLRSIRLLALLLIMLPLPAARAQQGASGRFLRFEPAVVNLGDLQAAQDSVCVNFDFENISEDEVTLADVVAQCTCTKAHFRRESIPAGGKSSLRVTLYLRDLIGAQKRHLTVVSTNGERYRYSTITIICNVNR